MPFSAGVRGLALGEISDPTRLSWPAGFFIFFFEYFFFFNLGVRGGCSISISLIDRLTIVRFNFYFVLVESRACWRLLSCFGLRGFLNFYF